jgi:hypothetical protein
MDDQADPIELASERATATDADAVAPVVGWTAPGTVAAAPLASGLIPVGAALSIIAGLGGVLSVILPYANFIGGDAFRLIPVLDPESFGAGVWLGLEPLALAIGLVVLGFAGLVRPTRLGAGLTFGLGIALLLNHGGFLAYLFDPQIAGNPETGLLVGVGAGALATLGGLVSMATRAKRRAVAA